MRLAIKAYNLLQLVGQLHIERVRTLLDTEQEFVALVKGLRL